MVSLRAPDHEEVCAPRLLQDIGHRKRLRGTPFNSFRAFLDAGAKLRLEFGQPRSNRGGLLIEELLRRAAIGKIQWRPEVRRGNADDPRSEALGQIPGHRETGIVGSVQRQADHDGFVVHILLHALVRNYRMGDLPMKRHFSGPIRGEPDLDQGVGRARPPAQTGIPADMAGI